MPRHICGSATNWKRGTAASTNARDSCGVHNLVADRTRCVPTKIWTYRANLRRDPCRNCVMSAGKWREISAFTGLHRGATCTSESLNRMRGEVFHSDCVSIAPFRFPSGLLQPLGHLSVSLESIVYRLVGEPANPNCVTNCVRPLNLARSLTGTWGDTAMPTRAPPSIAAGRLASCSLGSMRFRPGSGLRPRCRARRRAVSTSDTLGIRWSSRVSPLPARVSVSRSVRS